MKAMLVVCTQKHHSGVVLDVVALAGGGTARTILRNDFTGARIRVHPGVAVGVDDLTEDELGDLLLDVVCNDDRCAAV